MLNLILLLIVAYAMARTYDDVRGKIRESRQRRLARREQQAAPAQLTSRQRRATTFRHDTGWWLREALSGFPSTLHGFQAGWLSHSAQTQQQKAERAGHRRNRDSWRARNKPVPAAGDVRQQPVPDPAGARAPAPEPAAPGPPEHQPGAAVPPAATPQPDPPAPPGEGESEMPATTVPEATYDQLQAQAGSTLIQLEARLEELRREQWAALADGVAGALRAGETLGNMADMVDEIEQEMKIVQQRMESTQVFSDTLKREHGDINEAVRDAPVPAAQPEFYGE